MKRYVEAVFRGRSPREQRLERALHHLAHRDHELQPSRCASCLEVAGFLTIPGYDGDIDYPLVH